MKLKVGEVVVVPTDTVYGVFADAVNDNAVSKVFDLKGRDFDKPLVLLVGSVAMLEDLVQEVGDREKQLMERFWPGALTLILKKSELVSDLITAGGNTVGVRMPAHPLALEIINALGRPVVATSVNRSGQPALNDVAQIRQEFPGLEILDDAGSPVLGLESTVLDMTVNPPIILREGALGAEVRKFLNL